jgi:hypothetical protein
MYLKIQVYYNKSLNIGLAYYKNIFYQLLI